MNKIYKTVYNETSQTWVAVSEIETGHGKSAAGVCHEEGRKLGGRWLPVLGASFATFILNLAAVSGLSLLPASNAVAAVYCRATTKGSTASRTGPQNSVVCGTNASVATLGGSLDTSGIAIGYNATVVNNYMGIALGGYAQAGSSTGSITGQNVAIGYRAQALGDQSVALGGNVHATGVSSVAIGGDDLDNVAGTSTATLYNQLTGDSITRGDYTFTNSGVAAVAVGVQAQAMGALSTAFGTKSKANAAGSVALGVGANANQDNAVALGAGSTTATNAAAVSSATVGNLTYSGFAGDDNVNAGDQVSVGSVGYERQIKNVAPGAISSTSTDAINGSQLYATQDVIGNVADSVVDVLGGDAAVDAATLP